MKNLFTSNVCIPILYNRDGIDNDGWIHIVPAGELPNKESGVVQVLDRKSHEAIVGNLNADKQRLGNRWPGLYMGEEHFIYDQSKSSEAFLWAKEFKIEPDGVWAKGDATDVGEPAIKNRRFKFTSFVTNPQIPNSIETVAKNKVRILKIDTVGFTNYPNGRGLLSPITNRQEFRHNRAEEAGDLADKQNSNKKMKSIATLLGLSAEASEEAIHAEVTKIMNRASTAEAALTPMTNRATTAEAKVKDLEGAQIETDLEVYKNRFKPAAREGWKKALISNRADTIELLKGMDVLKEAVAPGRISNRETQQEPGKQGSTITGVSAEQAQKNSQEVVALVSDYCIKNRCAHEIGWNAIQREKPELFAPVTE